MKAERREGDGIGLRPHTEADDLKGQPAGWTAGPTSFDQAQVSLVMLDQSAHGDPGARVVVDILQRLQSATSQARQ